MFNVYECGLFTSNMTIFGHRMIRKEESEKKRNKKKNENDWLIEFKKKKKKDQDVDESMSTKF